MCLSYKYYVSRQNVLMRREFSLRKTQHFTPFEMKRWAERRNSIRNWVYRFSCTCVTFDDWINVESLWGYKKLLGVFFFSFLLASCKADAWLIDSMICSSREKKTGIDWAYKYNGLFVSCLQVKIQSICRLISPDLNAKCAILFAHPMDKIRTHIYICLQHSK